MKGKAMIIDTHSHLFWKDFDEDRSEVLIRARANGVERMLVVGTDVSTSEAAWDLCQDEPGLYPTAGIHPHDAQAMDDPGALDRIEEICRRAGCVAVGETGLDFFKEYSPREAQERAFRWHLNLARELDKPVIIHCREAHEATLAAIREYPGVRGVMHCYTMGPGELHHYLDAGLYISFSGIVTFPKSEANRAAATEVPLERLLVETDCPFLAPQGHRGKRNEPAYTRVVLEHIAEARGLEAVELAQITSHNANALFELESR
ncbi:MAG: TatD family hydrolase [Planctomycetota bacterium]|nr:TatD family hydrolase [Planctomycetota bacterium]